MANKPSEKNQIPLFFISNQNLDYNLLRKSFIELIREYRFLKPPKKTSKYKSTTQMTIV